MKHRLVPAAASATFVALLGSSHAATPVPNFADVVSATPITVPVTVPGRVCRDERQFVQAPTSGAGAVIGAIAGAVIGHNVGGGFGRAAATGLGVVAGSVIGDQVEANNTPAADVALRRCQTVSRVESRVVGYDVMYEYAGQRYSTRMGRDPGARLAIEVRPADGGGEMLPAPADTSRQTAQAVPATVPQVVYYASEPTYYAPSPPYYFAPPAVYLSPFIGFGIGISGGYYRGHYGGYYSGRGRHEGH